MKEPLLQIIHYSDIHLVADGYTQSRWGINRAFPHMPHLWKQGLASARLAVLESFIEVIEGHTTLDANWHDKQTWLVDTGDGTTFGDSPSLDDWNDWSRKFETAAGKNCQLLRVYGNHDAWPGKFPIPSLMHKQENLLRSQYFNTNWPEDPLSIQVPRTGSQIELCVVNTVDHRFLPSVFANGLAARDHYSSNLQSIPVATPADDLAKKSSDTLGGWWWAKFADYCYALSRLGRCDWREVGIS